AREGVLVRQLVRAVFARRAQQYRSCSERDAERAPRRAVRARLFSHVAPRARGCELRLTRRPSPLRPPRNALAAALEDCPPRRVVGGSPGDDLRQRPAAADADVVVVETARPDARRRDLIRWEGWAHPRR